MSQDGVRSQGVVKFFNDSKGWGFIKPDGQEEEIFVHYSSVAMDGYKSLAQGTRVEFEIVDGKKGKQAINVTRI